MKPFDFKMNNIFEMPKRSVVGKLEDFHNHYDLKNNQKNGKKYLPKSRISVIFMNNINRFLLKYAKMKSFSKGNSEQDDFEKLNREILAI